MTKPRYNSKGWVLCECLKCGRVNYCEPHGTTAKCRCSREWTEHRNIPYERGDLMVYIAPKGKDDRYGGGYR